MPKLTLYHYNGCPYCQRVKDYMAENKIVIPMKNVKEEPGVREELMNLGGKTQVPCLVIDGKALYESLDIIEWLKKNYKRP